MLFQKNEDVVYQEEPVPENEHPVEAEESHHTPPVLKKLFPNINSNTKKGFFSCSYVAFYHLTHYLSSRGLI